MSETISERNIQAMGRTEKKQHLKSWIDFKQEAMKEAEELFGKLNKDNHRKITQYVKAAEKRWKRGER